MYLSHQLGQEGEQEAHTYLEEKGYRVLKKNWRVHHLEVDLIVQHKDVLVFVEVKTRTFISDDLSSLITRSKMKHLIEAAHLFVETYTEDVEVRFDVIAIVGEELHHFEDAFKAWDV